jgi:acyl-CoA thioester hydrolase
VIVPDSAVAVEIEVPFHDVDALRVVWHGHYYKYFEIARTALFRELGLDQTFYLDQGFALVVMESQCRYKYPLRFGDRARVSAWFGKIDHTMTIRFELTNTLTGKRCATGRTRLATLDSEGKLLTPIPDAILSKINVP